MKHNIGALHRMAAIVLIAVGAVAFLGGCWIGGPVPGFEITLNVDGTEYRMVVGYTDTDTYDSGANGSSFSWTGGLPPETITGFRMAAAGANVTDMASEGPFILLSIPSEAVGSYTLSDDVYVSLTLDGAELLFTTAFADLEITVTETSDEIGGTVAGTITGSLSDGSPVTGTFRVERLADDAIQTPDPFKV
jgi:hypothetical protein